MSLVSGQTSKDTTIMSRRIIPSTYWREEYRADSDESWLTSYMPHHRSCNLDMHVRVLTQKRIGLRCGLWASCILCQPTHPSWR